MSDLSLSSPEFQDGGTIPVKYTSDGDNINPPIDISGVSKETKSLVLIVDDPDAATDPDGPGKTFDHWVVFNISPTITQIEENSLPTGSIVAKNGMGESKYIGPAPPNGKHRYYFKLYELLDILDLDTYAVKEDVEKAMQDKIIGQAQLVATYERQK
ncbi:MAG: YbhB/YbcL family Raf kinase inhibitor-like protein [Candidatus Saccharimonadales bacterium]